MKNNLIAISLLLLFVQNEMAGDTFRTWDKKNIIRISVKFIEEFRTEFLARAAAIKKETGEVVPLNLLYFQNLTAEENKVQEKFLSAKLSKEKSNKYLTDLLVNLEVNRKILANAEEVAEKSWNKKNAKNDALKDAEEISEKLYGTEVKSKKLGVILDNSGSMNSYLPALRKEISQKFPNAKFVEIYGNFINRSGGKYLVSINPAQRLVKKPLAQNFADCKKSCHHWYYLKCSKGENPFQKKWFAQSIPAKRFHFWMTEFQFCNLLAMEALVYHHKVDAIYWFTDLKDNLRKGLPSLENLVKKTNVKLYIHTVDKKPISPLRSLIKKSGGKVITERVK
jgi:hypothetical protein